MTEADSAAIDAWVSRAVATAPPLRPEQRDKLRTLLTGALSDSATAETVLDGRQKITD